MAAEIVTGDKGRQLTPQETEDYRARAAIALSESDAIDKLIFGKDYKPSRSTTDNAAVQEQAALIDDIANGKWAEKLLERTAEQREADAMDVLAATNKWKIQQAAAIGPNMVVTDGEMPKFETAFGVTEDPTNGKRTKVKIEQSDNGIDIINLVYPAGARPIFSGDSHDQLSAIQHSRLTQFNGGVGLPELGVLGESLQTVQGQDASRTYIVGPINRPEEERDPFLPGESGHMDINYVPMPVDVHDIERMTHMAASAEMVPPQAL